MKIRCNACDAVFSIANDIADDKVARRSVRVRCRNCGTTLSASIPSPSLSSSGGSTQEDSGLIDIRAMAAVLGAGALASGPADEVAVSAQPSLPASLPMAGVIMPIVEPARPWWLVPSLAVGGMLLVAVVALLAVLLLQPTGASRTSGGDPAPGGAAAKGTTAARVEVKTEAEIEARTAPRVAPPQPAPAPAPAPAVTGQPRRPPKVRPRKRRPRRDREVVVKPNRTPKKIQPKEPRHRPRSISEILDIVAKRPTKSLKVPPHASLPAKLGYREIQRGVSAAMGVARACGRRYSTSGRVKVRLVVAGVTGKVLAVSPKGTHAGSLTGRCVSRALRSARFKRFARSRQSFYYTVVLR